MTEFDFNMWISIICATASWSALIFIYAALKGHEKAMKDHREFLLGHTK